MGLHEPIDCRVETFVGLFDQVAPESGRNEIIVDCVGLEGGGIRRFRQVLANALHGRDEFLTGLVRIGGSPWAGGGRSELQAEQEERQGSRRF